MKLSFLRAWFTWSCCLLTIESAAAQQQPQLESPLPADSPPRTDRHGDPLPVGALARLGTVRFRHNGPIWGVAYSADGKSIVTASEDQTIRRWDAVSGQELTRIPAPGFVALSPHGDTWISIDPDDPKARKKRLVRLWNTDTRQEIGRFEWFGRYGDHRSTYHLDAAFSQDGSTLAVGNYNSKVILLWDVARGRELRQIDYIGLDCLALSPDGKTLLTGSDETLWDVASGTKLKTFSAQYKYGGTSAAAFSSDGKTLALGGGDASVLLFDVASGKQLRQLVGAGKVFGGAGGAVTSLAFSADGKLLAAGSNDWTVRLWDVAAGKQWQQLVGPVFGNVGNHGSILAVAFAPDGAAVAASSYVPFLRRWDTASGREISPPALGHRDRIHTLAHAPDGKRLATSSSDLTIRIWDAASSEELHELVGHTGSINGIAFSPDGRRLVSAGGFQDETLRWWDSHTGRSLREVQCGSAYAVAYAPDGQTVATAGSEGIRLWDAETGAALRQFAGRADHLYFSPEGRLLSDGARIWDLANGELTAELKSSKPVAFSPDWKLAAAASEVSHGSGVYSARLLEVATDQEVHRLAQEQAWMSSAVWSPDGKMVATAEVAGIRLWDPATGKELSRLNSLAQSWYYSLAFAPDGRTLASVNSDTTVLIWSVPSAPRPRPAEPLAPAELARLWETLADDDAAPAYAAIVRLVQAAEFALPFLKERAQAEAAPSAERLRQRIADLDDERFEVRQKASQELTELGELAEPALRAALQSELRRETLARVKTILAQRYLWSGNRLRQWRLIQVLEAIGTPDAQQALGTIAAGAPASRLTQAAQAALDRRKK